MHNTELPPDIVARAVKRRGKLHPFDSIDPARTALVVVDMQKAFCEPGLFLAVPNAKEIVPNINALAEATRRFGGEVVWVQMGIPDEASWPVFLGSMVTSQENIDQVLDILNPDGEGYKLLPELDVQQGDSFVTKTRFSAFMPGVTDLATRLRAKGIDTVLVTGTVTNVCSECTARDAAQLDFKVVMISDGNVCHSDASHTATLSSFISSFGDVRSTAEMIQMMAAASEAVA